MSQFLFRKFWCRLLIPTGNFEPYMLHFTYSNKCVLYFIFYRWNFFRETDGSIIPLRRTNDYNYFTKCFLDFRSIAFWIFQKKFVKTHLCENKNKSQPIVTSRSVLKISCLCIFFLVLKNENVFYEPLCCRWISHCI